METLRTRKLFKQWHGMTSWFMLQCGKEKQGAEQYVKFATMCKKKDKKDMHGLANAHRRDW